LTLAFVLLEPCDGKLSSTVPRGPGAGNRAWLPSTGDKGKLRNNMRNQVQESTAARADELADSYNDAS